MLVKCINMVTVERQMRIELTQGRFLNALSENNSSERFYLARKERKLVDIGEIRDDDPHRIIVGDQSAMAEIFPLPIIEKALDVFSVSMNQTEFKPQVAPDSIKGVLDIGHIDQENKASRTIIASKEQMHVIFPNMELPLI